MSAATALLHEDHRKLFLALTLVRSKPRQASIKEFLGQIRQNVQQGQQPDNVESQSYIDAVSFWKARHDEAEEHVAALKHEVAQLKLRSALGIMHTKSDSEQDTPHKANSQRKRKADSSMAQGRVCGPSKKRFALGQSAREARLDGSIDDIEVYLPDTCVTTYLENAHGLRRILTQSVPTTKDLAGAIVQLCHDITDLIGRGRLGRTDSIPEQSSHTTRTRAQEVKVAGQDYHCKLVVLKQSFCLLLDALGAYVSGPQSGSSDGMVTYAIAGVFRALLSCIHELSQPPLRPQERRELANKGRERAKQVEKIPFSGVGMEHVCFELAKIAVWLLSRLDYAIHIQKSVGDACLYFLLRSIGKKLKLFTFGIEGDEAPLIANNHSESRDNALEVSNEKPDAPYLVWILERAMAMFDSNTSISTIPGQTSAAKLSAHAIDKLQNTMLKAMFADNASSFEHSLLKPVEIELQNEDPLKVNYVEIAEWFTKKVWTVLGWEVLRRHVGS